MTNSLKEKVLEWLLNLPPETKYSTSIIDAIEQRLKTETDPDSLRTLQFRLADEYAFYGQYANAESVYHELYRQIPNEPVPLIALAEQKLYDEHNLSDAMHIIERAIKVAMLSGHFCRLALGVKARIALELCAYNVVEDVLKQLLELKSVSEKSDCGVERDFFERLPRAVINEVVEREYDKYSAPKT